MTFSDAYKKADETLKKSGILEHERDAALLLEFATGKGKTFLLTYGDERELSFGEAERLKEALKKRSSHIPLQHITGSVSFMGLEFLVSPPVLIPRIDTEFLVEEVLRVLPDGSEVLDLCTGSGCILLSLMKYKNHIRGTGSDISRPALELSEKNREKLGIRDAVFIESDLFNNITGSFDFIISNPPYIRSSEIASLMEEVRDFEPLTALDGGEDGLDFYRRIASGAGEHLKNGGRMFFETGNDEGEAVKEILERNGFKDIRIFKDYSDNERVVSCLKT